jgi:hypothetical protein
MASAASVFGGLNADMLQSFEKDVEFSHPWLMSGAKGLEFRERNVVQHLGHFLDPPPEPRDQLRSACGNCYVRLLYERSRMPIAFLSLRQSWSFPQLFAHERLGDQYYATVV